MPKLGASKESLEGFKPVPNGIYEIQLLGFEPKSSKNGDSINLNPVMKIVNNPQFNGQRVFWNCNTKASFLWHDFAHCFGLPVEMHKTGENGAEEAHLPGGPNAWTAADDSKPETYKYNGPLLNKFGKVELVEVRQPGQKAKNDIKQFVCRIDGCATKFPDVAHNVNLLK
jgi:hypothetical protein